MTGDPYGRDVLAARARPRPVDPEVPAEPGLLVHHRASRFTGTLVRIEAGSAVLRNARGQERLFPLAPGIFSVDGQRVTLVRARPAASATPARTASGSVAGPPVPARVARAARIYVEGVHDAELVEKVWGDDLRAEGIVVEYLEGIDHLSDVVRAFAPGPGRRLGVLVDHLVPGSKESRLAAAVEGPHVLVVGHPYVDVWQAVRPEVVGIAAWPVVPRGRPWKEGICAALGVADPRAYWRRILGSVRGYADLEQPLVGAVERLLDFLTEPEPST